MAMAERKHLTWRGKICGIKTIVNETERIIMDDENAVFLPSLGERTNSKIKLRPYIISPYDPCYRAWQNVLIVLVVYTAWVYPFEFGFLGKTKGPLAITDNIVNGFFFIDIITTFFVAYHDKETYVLIDTPKLIALRYVKSWLVLDVVSTIPSELVQKLPSPIESYAYFNLLRLWRLRRISEMFQRLEKDKNFNYFRVRVSKFICVTLILVHCAGCAFYHIGSRYPNPKHTWIATAPQNFFEKSLFDRYVLAFYWALVTFSATGYGDIHPVNPTEMIFDTVYMMINLGLLSYIIGNLNSLIVQGTLRTRKFRETIRAATSFAKRNQLPPRLQDQMIAHLCLRYRTDYEGLHQQETLDALPKAIRSSISNYLFSPLVDKVYLFQGISNDLLFQLVSEMKPEFFPPGEDVILQNEAPTDFYILVTGTVELISNRKGTEEVLRELKTGDVCGEIGVLCYEQQLFTVRTSQLSQLLRLNRTPFLNILQANVGAAEIILNNLLQHLKEYDDPVMQAVLAEAENRLARGRMELPLSLCFAAERGDDALPHHLLRRGLDPNEVNKDGCTALHLAVSKEKLESVLLLLDYGADPNIEDTKRNVPLWDAILGGNEAVKRLLVDNGATLIAGDVGQYACFATEQGNINLLKEIIKYKGDVTLLNNMGTTALHTAISEENAEIVKFLLDQGADINRADVYGWTPRALADYQGHEDIKDLFRTMPESNSQKTPHNNRCQASATQNAPYLKKYPSEPTLPVLNTSKNDIEIDLHGNSLRRKANNYQNSLFGIISAARKPNEVGGQRLHLPPLSHASSEYHPRVIICCPEKGDVSGRMVILPGSLQELLDFGYQTYGFDPTKILTKGGALIVDLEVIRDGDELILAS